MKKLGTGFRMWNEEKKNCSGSATLEYLLGHELVKLREETILIVADLGAELLRLVAEQDRDRSAEAVLDVKKFGGDGP